MKLKNKKTGEIKDFALVIANSDVKDTTLAELCEEWVDLPKEEPEEYWVIDIRDGVGYKPYLEEPSEMDFEIGNYFKTKEEAELALNKLKAWKRLKDAGFKFSWWDTRSCYDHDREFVMFSECDGYVKKYDLDLLFRGEECYQE